LRLYFTQPSPSTIRFSPSELAFRTLLEDIQQDETKCDHEYKTRFVLRDSTGASRKTLAPDPG
jgi:hypothetical protein